MSKNVRRRGFTLPEVLVTITIVAVLAAVVVPAVLNQVNKGDTAALSGDIDALRSAISNFTTDTRHYPKTIDDLVNPIDDADLDLFGAAYGLSAQNAWKGPYFPTSQTVTTSYLTSAFGLTIDTDLEAPDATAVTGNDSFITLVFTNTGVPHSTIALIDRLFDGGDGTVLADDATNGCAAGTDGHATGKIRWTNASTGSTCTVSAIKWRLVSAAK